MMLSILITKKSERLLRHVLLKQSISNEILMKFHKIVFFANKQMSQNQSSMLIQFSLHIITTQKILTNASFYEIDSNFEREKVLDVL